MISISKSISIKILAALFIASGIMTYGFKTHIAKAAVGVTGLTGKYGCMTNRNFPPTTEWLTGNSNTGANFLYILDFDAGTGVAAIFLNNNWGLKNNVTSSVVAASGAFTQANGPAAGIYTINFTDGQSYNLVPVNSGNTLFLSAASTVNYGTTPETGICQKQ